MIDFFAEESSTKSALIIALVTNNFEAVLRSLKKLNEKKRKLRANSAGIKTPASNKLMYGLKY